MSGYGRRKVLAAQYSGDPGLFGFLGKAIGSVAKVIPGVSSIYNAADMGVKLLTGGSKPATGKAAVLGPTSSSTLFAPVQTPPPQLPNQYGLVNIVKPGSGPQLFPSGPGNNTQSGPGAGTNWTPREQSACQAGYHKNKHDYWTKKYGFIPKHSVCVKNRRRNPLNPRAASRSMSRLKSAQKAARFLGKFSFGGHRGNGKAVAAAKGCGCKGRR